MLLNTLIKIKISSKTLRYFLEKGYKCEVKETIEINISDLHLTSSVKVMCVCDKCGNIVERPYGKYLSNKNKYYFSCSRKCSKYKNILTCLKRYGVEYATKNKDIRNKIKKTNNMRYGGNAPACSKSIQDKIKKTNNTRYGGNAPACSKSIQDKIKKTCLKKYGKENVFQSEIIKDKIKETNLERYNVEYPLQNKEILEKVRLTNLERYNVEHPLQNKEILEKVRLTNLERYNVEYPLQNKAVYDKLKSTNLERYGVENVFQSEITKDKIKETNLERYGTEYYLSSSYNNKEIINKRLEKFIKLGIKENNIISVYNNEINIKCYNCEKEYNITNWLLFQRLKYFKTEPCTNCNPISSSSGKEKELFRFIQDNYSGSIIKGDRKILEGKELDIYLPDFNLAFEFNGTYWHSELFKDKDYHLNKTEYCLKKNVHLIHIYEDDWNYKQDIVKSEILNVLYKPKKINFNYTIKCVDSNISKLFLECNHLKGSIESNIKLGLYDDEELVSIMILDEGIKGHYNLLRLCNKINNSIELSDKLFKYFIKNYSPKEIVSYYDRSWNGTDFFINLGFKFIKNTDPNCYYIIENIRKTQYDDLETNLDTYRIYDSGSIKYIWK